MEAMLAGHFVAQGLHAVATLAIPDLIAHGHVTIDDLAKATFCHGPSLHRLMRTLASLGVFAEVAEGEFSLTPLGATLRSDTPDSVRDKAIFETSAPIWEAWAGFIGTLRNGEPSFPQVHHRSVYGYLADHPEAGADFNRFMTAQSNLHNAAIVDAYDFSGIAVLVDVGGGRGATLAAVLETYSEMTGILFDLPEVVTPRTQLQTSRFADRCDVVGGNMLESVPIGGNAYIVKRVFMEQTDDDPVKVLRNCARAMNEGGRVLVIDPMLPHHAEPHPNRLTDLLMLVLTGGRCRTEPEFRELFNRSGLALTRVIGTRSPNFVVEAIRG